MIEWDYRKRQWLRSQELIINCLRDSPKTYTELLQCTGLSRSVLSNHLKHLQKEGRLIKELIEGQKTPVYNLTDKARSGVDRLLRQLRMLSYQSIDVKHGEKLLTQPVLEASIEIMQKIPDNLWKMNREVVLSTCKLRKFVDDRGREVWYSPWDMAWLTPPKEKLDPFNLLIILDIYDRERKIGEVVSLLEDEKMSQYLKQIYDKPEDLFTLPIIRKRKLVKEFDNLTEWYLSQVSSYIPGMGNLLYITDELWFQWFDRYLESRIIAEGMKRLDRR